MWENLGKNLGEFSFLHKYDPINCKNTKIEGFKYAKSLVLENKKKMSPKITKEIQKELKSIEKKTNKKFGDLKNPLLVSEVMKMYFEKQKDISKNINNAIFISIRQRT